MDNSQEQNGPGNRLSQSLDDESKLSSVNNDGFHSTSPAPSSAATSSVHVTPIAVVGNRSEMPANDESPMDDHRTPVVKVAQKLPQYRFKRSAMRSQTIEARSVSVSDDLYGPTVRERNASMLFNECMADVWFIVGGSCPQTSQTHVSQQQMRIPAHSYVLAIGSSVFYAMFYGGFSKTEDVHVPDVDVGAFKILLKYLYTDAVELDLETVLPTLYVAKKYLVTHLIKACIRFLEDSLNAQNVCLLLAQSRLFEEEELMQRCWDVVDAQTEMALSSEGFLDIDIDTLASILNRETLSCRETTIYNACLRWAEAECVKRRSLEPTSQNKRQVLGRCFHLIRFPAMKVEELADYVAPHGLLDSNELSNIFLHHYARRKPELAFVTRPRVKLPVQRCLRFQTSAYRNNQWHYRGRCDSVQFCTDKRIFVIGFGLYGSSTGSAEYKVSLELKKNGQTLASVANSRLFTDGSSNVFPVYFDQPVQVEPDVFYTASTILDGDQLSYFGQEGLPEVQTDRVTFQFQCSAESTNGTGVQGGQIPEILFYC